MRTGPNVGTIVIQYITILSRALMLECDRWILAPDKHTGSEMAVEELIDLDREFINASDAESWLVSPQSAAALSPHANPQELFENDSAEEPYLTSPPVAEYSQPPSRRVSNVSQVASGFLSTRCSVSRIPKPPGWIAYASSTPGTPALSRTTSVCGSNAPSTSCSPTKGSGYKNPFSPVTGPVYSSHRSRGNSYAQGLRTGGSSMQFSHRASAARSPASASASQQSYGQHTQPLSSRRHTRALSISSVNSMSSGMGSSAISPTSPAQTRVRPHTHGGRAPHVCASMPSSPRAAITVPATSPFSPPPRNSAITAKQSQLAIHTAGPIIKPVSAFRETQLQAANVRKSNTETQAAPPHHTTPAHLAIQPHLDAGKATSALAGVSPNGIQLAIHAGGTAQRTTAADTHDQTSSGCTKTSRASHDTKEYPFRSNAKQASNNLATPMPQQQVSTAGAYQRQGSLDAARRAQMSRQSSRSQPGSRRTTKSQMPAVPGLGRASDAGLDVLQLGSPVASVPGSPNQAFAYASCGRSDLGGPACLHQVPNYSKLHTDVELAQKVDAVVVAHSTIMECVQQAVDLASSNRRRAGAGQHAVSTSEQPIADQAKRSKVFKGCCTIM